MFRWRVRGSVGLGILILALFLPTPLWLPNRDMGTRQAYGQTTITVRAPTNATGVPDAVVMIPLTVPDSVTELGILAYQFRFIYNSSILQLTDVSVEDTLSASWDFVVNDTVAGQVDIAAYGTAPLVGAGSLIHFHFHVIGTVGQQSPLQLINFVFNEGLPSVQAANGLLTVVDVPTQTITVQKVVVGGGPLGPDDFSLFVDDTAVIRGVETEFSTGMHIISETEDPRYSASYSGACNQLGSVMLNSGEHRSCTITNTYITQTLTVEKVVLGGGPLQAGDFSLFIDGTAVSRGVPRLLAAGQHTVSETPDARYASTFSGACDGSGQVDLAIGEHLTCTITNRFIVSSNVASLTIRKVVVGSAPDDDWNFSVSGSPGAFAIDRLGGSQSFVVAAGKYTVREDAKAGYAPAISCSDGTAGTSEVTLDLAGSENVTCTFTNIRLSAALVVTKTVGINPTECAEDKSLDVPEGVTVYYCVTAHNTGQVTLTNHTLNDSLLGLLQFDADLPPNSMLTTLASGVTLSHTVTISTINQVTWTATAPNNFTAQAASDASVRVLHASAEVDVTASIDPEQCGSDDELTVPLGTPIYLCLFIENTGPISFTWFGITHNLTGAEQLMFRELPPGGSLTLTHVDSGALGPLIPTEEMTLILTLRLGNGGGPPASEAVAPVFAVNVTVSIVIRIDDIGDAVIPRMWIPQVRR